METHRLVPLAQWLDADPLWIAHVADCDYVCGCRPDGTYCDQWRMFQDTSNALWQHRNTLHRYRVLIVVAVVGVVLLLILFA